MSWGRLEVRATSPTKEYMIRIKVIKDKGKYKKGEVYHLTKNEAFGLIDSGFAILTKDITEKETVTKDGSNHIIVRANYPRRR